MHKCFFPPPPSHLALPHLHPAHSRSHPSRPRNTTDVWYHQLDPRTAHRNHRPRRAGRPRSLSVLRFLHPVSLGIELLRHPQVLLLTVDCMPANLNRHVASFGHPDRILPIALGTRVGRHVQFMDRTGVDAMHRLALGRAVALVAFSRYVLL